MKFGEDVRAFDVILRLDDYLWFSSHEWGNNNETTALVHNYALSFALSGGDRILAFGGTPDYEGDLATLDVYCSPARLLADQSIRQLRAVFTFNSIDGPTQRTQALRIGEKVNDPKFGKRQVLYPGLRFHFVAFTRNAFDLPRVFRLGKKRSPVVIETIKEIRGNTFEGTEQPNHAVNPLDVAGVVEDCIMHLMPPHMIYEEATIAGDHFLRAGADAFHIPKRVMQWHSP